MKPSCAKMSDFILVETRIKEPVKLRRVLVINLQKTMVNVSTESKLGN